MLIETAPATKCFDRKLYISKTLPRRKANICFQNNGKFTFAISHTSFKRYKSANVFYVLVLRHDVKNEFIIIPSRQLQYFMDAGYITDAATLSLYVAADARSTKFMLNGKADVTPFYGKFGEIIV